MRKRKPIYGIAINDADYLTQWKVDGKLKSCPFYARWKQMLRRCYSSEMLHQNPTYSDISVCDEWLRFSNFKTWMEGKDWDGKHLDKDILVIGNKQYHPERCVFVDIEVNILLCDSAAKRNGLPLGVSKGIGKYKYQASIGEQGVNRSLGLYNDKMLAHKIWQQEKAKNIKHIAMKQKDSRVMNALLLRVNILEKQISLGLETVSIHH